MPRDSGESIFAARHQDVSQGPLGALCGKISCVALRGFSLRGFGNVRGFPFCGGKKGLRLPLAVGKRVLDSLFPYFGA